MKYIIRLSILVLLVAGCGKKNENKSQNKSCDNRPSSNRKSNSSSNRSAKNKAIFNSVGLHKNGTYFDENGLTVDGTRFHKGRDVKGRDVLGRDLRGFDVKGFYRGLGKKLEKPVKFDPQGYDVEGFNKIGFTQKQIDGKTIYLHRCGSEYDEQGYNYKGFDNRGFNLKRLNKETNTLYNKNGLDWSGLPRNESLRSHFENLKNLVENDKCLFLKTIFTNKVLLCTSVAFFAKCTQEIRKILLDNRQAVQLQVSYFFQDFFSCKKEESQDVFSSKLIEYFLNFILTKNFSSEDFFHIVKPLFAEMGGVQAPSTTLLDPQIRQKMSDNLRGYLVSSRLEPIVNEHCDHVEEHFFSFEEAGADDSCFICLEDAENLVKLKADQNVDCKAHDKVLCKECLYKSLRGHINDQEFKDVSLVCPICPRGDKCTHKISFDLAVPHLSGKILKEGVLESENNSDKDYEDASEQLEIWKQRIFERKLARIPNWHSCPAPYGCIDGSFSNNDPKQHFHCGQCQYQGRLQIPSDEKEIQDLLKEGAIKEPVQVDPTHPERGKYRPCPHCGLIAERVGGCSYMVCRECRKHWNWDYGTLENLDKAIKEYRDTPLAERKGPEPIGHDHHRRVRRYVLSKGLKAHFVPKV